MTLNRGSRLILDTNAATAIIRRDPAVLECLKHNPAAVLPSVTLGELYYGAWNSARTSSNLEAIRALVLHLPVIEVDQQTAEMYGLIRSQLRAKGRPIPENDVWIAAIARQQAMPVLTRDAHFRYVDDIQVVSW